MICPHCGKELKKRFWTHLSKDHPDKSYEETVLTIMNLSEWPTYELDGEIKKYKFDQHKLKFIYQSVSDGSKVSVRERMKNPNEKLKISNALKNAYKEHPEYREKCSNALKRRYEDPEYHKKLSNSQKKRFEDPEARRKMAEQVSSRYKDPEYAKKCSEAIKASRQRDPSIIKRISTGVRKYYESDEARIKASESHRKSHRENPEIGEKHSEWMINHYKETGDHLGVLSKEYKDEHMNNGIWTSGAESKFINVLRNLGYEILSVNEPAYTSSSKYFIDCVIKINDTKIAIEIDGGWCHDKRYEADLKRDKAIHEDLGYKIFRLNSNIARYLSDKDKIQAVLMDVVNNEVYYKILTTRDLFIKWRDSKIKLIDVINGTDPTVK